MAKYSHMNMEMPKDLFNEEVEAVSGDDINIESAQNLINELESKIQNGEPLTKEELELVKEKLGNLRDLQPDIDGPEIRNAIVRLVELLNSEE